MWGRGMDTLNPEGEVQAEDTALFSRTSEVDEETFEGDLLLLHRTLQTVVVLNPVAVVLWEALQWPLSKHDLAGLLTEAHPELSLESVLAKVSETVGLLEENGFITPASG
jgi:hypothetical protein